MRINFALFLCLVAVSCGKEPLMDVSTEMAGTWTHYSNETDHHILYINADGTGKLEWYNDDGLYKDTKVRDWYFKDNTMYFGKTSFNGELYDIIDYPVTAGSGFSNYYDTIPPGARYCILDDVYYVELP